MYLLAFLQVLRIGESLDLCVFMLHAKYFSGSCLTIVDASLELIEVS